MSEVTCLRKHTNFEKAHEVSAYSKKLTFKFITNIIKTQKDLFPVYH